MDSASILVENTVSCQSASEGISNERRNSIVLGGINNSNDENLCCNENLFRNWPICRDFLKI
jgi:hypothetical protein